METWYPIPTHPEYEVSTIGRVRRTDSGEPLRTFKRGNSYQVTLSVNGEKYTTSTRALVVAALPRDMAESLGWVTPAGHKERYLHPSLVQEILSLEGVTTSRDAAIEFNISEARVQSIWNAGLDFTSSLL